MTVSPESVATTEKSWKQIKGFSGYAIPLAHPLTGVAVRDEAASAHVH